MVGVGTGFALLILNQFDMSSFVTGIACVIASILSRLLFLAKKGNEPNPGQRNVQLAMAFLVTLGAVFTLFNVEIDPRLAAFLIAWTFSSFFLSI
jgi:hypothetical protein